MQINPADNYFALYSLPISFEVNLGQLNKRHRALMAEFHPDRYASADALSRRKSVQMATLLNEASTTLKTPLLRAGYLLSLAGEDTNSDTQTTSDMDFLMQQMQWRETIESLSQDKDQPLEKLTTLEQEIAVLEENYYQQFTDAYNDQQYADAKQWWFKLQFFNRLHNQLDSLQEKLDLEAF